MNSNDILTIVTVFKKNPGWEEEYVYRLKQGIERHLSIPFRFVCISDVELECDTLPLQPIDNIKRRWAIWYKMQLWRPEFELTGKTLFIDLDMLILDDFADIINQIKGNNFLMSNDPWRGDISCSALMYWEGDHSDLWKTFDSQPMSHWVEEFQEASNRRQIGIQQAFVAAHKEHKLIQNIIKDPKRTDRVKKGAHTEKAAILFCSGNRKPWNPLMLKHPDVKKYWLGEDDETFLS